MSRSKKIDPEIKPVVTNLIQQNCFIRDLCICHSVASDPLATYTDVEEVLRSDGTGVDLVYSENQYPITPDYVNSFAESADYRNDPAGAVRNAISRKNLGDIRTIQDLNSMDTYSQLELYQQLKAKFSGASAKSDAGQTVDPSTSSSSSSDGGSGNG